MIFAKVLYFASGIVAAIISWFIQRYVNQQDKKSDRHYESLKEVGDAIEQVENEALERTNARRQEIEELRNYTDERFETAYLHFPSEEVVNLLIKRLDRLADRMERLSELQVEIIQGND